MHSNIIQLLDDAARRFSDRTVYIDPNSETASITFQELDHMTKAVGTALIKEIQAEKQVLPIAVMTGRHYLTPACFLGVARAGHFYAPMDLDLPISRLIQIMNVAKPPYLIIDSEGKSKADEVLSALSESVEYPSDLPKVLILEDLLSETPDEALLEKAQENLTELTPLYMIFTSGSTGTPKGVLTSHYSLMCYLDALNQVIHLDETDVLGNQSPLDYIAAVRDMYLPLLSGGHTVIIPRNTTAMPEELFKLLNEYGVTTLCWSASGLEVLARLGAFDDDEIPKPASIRRIVFSGSVMSGKYLKMWKDALPGTLFINQYGPTETTASCTYYTVPDDITEETVLPIGKAYKHYSVFLLDGDNPVPKGEVGEICVTGPALALGYYLAPEQTSSSFMRNPLEQGYYERMYRTGDLGRIMEDGNLEFLGRKDRQIKHMGHRIELAEIENAAMKVPALTQGISMYDQEKGLLYLFYTGEATPKDITVHFRATMPAYMVPRKIVFLEDIPLLHNGKIDMPSLKKMMK